jgi:hypothetical protein
MVSVTADEVAFIVGEAHSVCAAPNYQYREWGTAARDPGPKDPSWWVMGRRNLAPTTQ